MWKRHAGLVLTEGTPTVEIQNKQGAMDKVNTALPMQTQFNPTLDQVATTQAITLDPAEFKE